MSSRPPGGRVRLRLAWWAVLFAAPAVTWGVPRSGRAGQLTASPHAMSDSIPLIVTGTVREEAAGRPLDNVRINIPALALSGWSDGDGRYELRTSMSVRGISTVEAALPGYFPEMRRDRLWCHWMATSTAEATECRIRLDIWMRRAEFEKSARPTCSVSGQIRERRSGVGQPGLVEVDGTELGAVSDEQGSYLIEDVPAGIHSIRVRALGLVEESRLVWVACSEGSTPIPLTFRLAVTPVM